MEQKSAVLFVNGSLRRLRPARRVLRSAGLVVAVDGGSRHLKRLGVTPHWLVGDLDSLPAGLLEDYTTRGVHVFRFPPAKDETDLELALQLVLKEGYSSVRVMGALGGRTDQTLGNIFLLSRPAFAGLDIRLDDGREEVYLLREGGFVDGKPGDTVSLLPLGRDTERVETINLVYPLRGERLYADRTRGISNVMETARAEVRCPGGILICVHTRS